MATYTLDRGTTFAITVNYQNEEAGNDITGSTILFTVKETEFDNDLQDSSALIQKNVTNHVDPTNGVSRIVINPSDTRGVIPGRHFYSIKIDVNSDDSEVYELDEGRFIIDGDPTNREA